MRWLRPLAAAGVICFLLALGEASAQSAPGAPDGLAAVGRVHALHVTWKPPATDGGSPVTSYVLRYISSAARDKSAENWTVVENLPVSANPEYTITGLIDEHAYDLEVRAVNASGEGAWAAITSQETLDNPGSQAGAPTLALGSSLPGSLSSSVALDEDMFKLVLTESTRVFIYSTGETDVLGEVCPESSPLCNPGERVTGGYDDDSNYLHPELNFAMLLDLDAGTYYLLTTPATPGTSGLYTVGAVELADPGSTTATATALSLPVVTGGDISSAGDVDYFSLTLSEETYIRFRAMMIDGSAGLTPTLLTGATEVELHVRGASFWSVEGSRGLVTGWAKLGAGTHHLKFTTAAGMPTGEYALRIWNDTEYADLINTCTGKTTPQTDPLYACQWTLNNTLAATTTVSEADLLTGYFAQSGDIVNEDINVEGVWATNKGAGINIAVVDTGMDTGHEDLTDNLDETRHYDYHGKGQANQIFSHGTLVAGVIAARDNDIGVRGVAPRATIYSYNLIRYDYTDTFDLVDAMTRNLDVTAISNNSWGFPDTGAPRIAEAVWEQAVRRGVEDGYGGKGIFYTWAAGNGDQPEFPADHSNLDGRANFYAVTAACAIGHDDRKNYDSERGANLWVCAPVDSGYTGDPLLVSTDDADRYAVFGSTSGATAVVSGVAALVRAANNELSWREVKLILAASARKNDPTHSSWATGALRYGSATNRYSFSHRYGFGAVDAGAAVTLAGTWTKAPDLREVEVKSAMLDEVIADGTSSGGVETPGALISKTITVTGNYVDFIEFVELEVTVDHPSFRDLEIKLQSPSGAVSTLAWHVPIEQYANGKFDTYSFNGAFRFGASKHLGESPRGAWTLTLQDKSRDDEGKLQGWRLKVYGHGSKPGFTKISSIVPGAAALNVFWDAIEDIGGSAITSHTLRYIRSDAADKADSNWTEVPVARTTAPLSHVITGLAEDVKYDVQVRGVNAAGDGSWSESVDQTTASGNTEPAFADATAARSVAENTAPAQDIGDPVVAAENDGDSLTYTLGGTDASSFAIVEDSGQLQTKSALDFEAKALYSVIVSVSDSKDATGNADTADDDTIDVTISVTNADEAGALSVPGTPRVDSVLSASLSDPDGAVTSVTWTWESSSDGNTWTTIAGATTASYTPVAADLGRQLRVTASYTDPLGAGKSAVATLAAVQAALVVNDQPAFADTMTTRSVAENTVSGTDIGDPVEAGDDDGDSLAYTLGGDDASSFAIVEDSGQLQTRSALDFETKAMYSVTVSVSDSKDAGGNADTADDDTIDVTISVTNVNEQPAFSTDTATRSVAENTAAAQNIGAPVEATDDDDGDALTYSISGGTDAASFEIVAASGQLQTKSALDFETKASYSVIVSVSDSKDAGGNADTAADDTIDVTISVTNVDEPGSIALTSVQPQVGTPLTASLSDPDGAVTSVTWTWESSSDGNTWTTIAGATTASYTPVAADLGRQLRVTAAYTDPQGAGKSAVATLAAVQAALVVNHQPAFADTMTTRSVAENTVSGTDIGDPVEAGDDDDSSLTYTLGGTDASSFAIVEDSGQLQTRGALDFETKPSYSVTVSVSDKKDAGGNADTAVDDTIDVTISVTNVNEQPAFSTDTATRSVAENTAAAQNIGDPVEANDDDDGDSLAYTLGGTDAASFAIVAASGQLRTRGALDFETKSSYSVTVSVSDSKDAGGNADTAADDTIDVTISVTNADEAGALSVPGTPRVDSVLSASLSDPDGATTSVTWTWESSSDGNTWTTIAGATAASYTPVVADLGRQLRVTAAYTDPQGAGKSAVATLAAVQAALVVNEQPAFATDTATRSVAENTAAGEDIGAPVEASDDDDSSLTYTLGGDDAASFAIVEDSGQLQTRSALDFETKAMYSVTVSVSDKKDAGGNADTAVDDTIDVTISVTNANDQPAFSTDTATRSVAENTGAGEDIGAPVEATDDDDGDALTYSISGGTDASSFEIVAASGQLQTRSALDFETKSSYSVTVSVSDSKDATGNADTAADDTIDVTISVTNTDEAGALSVPGTPRVDSALSASLSDPDGAVTSVTWTWESSSDDGNTWTTIAGATTASYTPVATDLGRQLRVTAAYTDPQGSGKSAVATLAAVQAALVVNHQPAFADTMTTRSVAENTAAAQSIGAPVEAGDDDDGDSLTYTLGGDDASSFAIVPGSGQLQTRSALDFETKALYSVIVSVSDKKDAGGNADTAVDDTIDVTISVTDVNDQPAFADSSTTRSVAENTAAAQNIGDPVEATDDDDGDSLTYTLGGTDAASFAIVAASGQLQTRGALDFETKASYSVIVSVSDSKDAGGTADTAADDTIAVTISVTNADEAGALSVPGTPRVDSALSASLSDPDGAVTSVTWTWESSSDDGNTWTTIAGATTASYTPVAADLGRQLRVTAAYTDPQGAGKSAVATLAAVEAALVVNHQPAFATDTATRSVAENTAAAQNIGDPVEATDDDNSDSLTYTLGGDDAASFAIVEDSGQLQTRGALDFETKSSYFVTVSVSDEKDAAGNADTAVDDTIDVTISVTNVNEQPAFSTDTATRSVAENTAAGENIGAPVEATDDDDGDALTYSISGGTDASSFAIVAASGQLQTRSALDFETKASYSVIVSVSDSKDAGGNADTAADDTIDVTISVTNADEAGALSVPGTPRVDSALSASLSDPDGAVTSVTWTWESSSDDGNTWTTIAGATTASYTPVAADLGRQLRVTAAYTDPQGAGKSAVATLAAVEAALVVNHQPAFADTMTTRSVAENTAAAQNIGDPVEATDDDNSDSLTYTLGGTDASSFAIVPGSGQLQTRSALDFETKSSYFVTVSVSDEKDAAGNADTAVDDTIDVTISVTNVNEQPAFSTDTATRSVAENTAAGENIGAPVEATDDDDGDALTYSISGGTDASSFAIVAASGQLQTRSALDFETKASYSVIVSVSDSKDAAGTADTATDDTIDVTISVTNADEAGALSVPGTPRVDSELSASLSDPDGAVTSVTWTWESSSDGNTWTTIAGATTASYTPVAADLGRQLRVTAAYTDPQGAGKSAVATLAAVEAALVVNDQPAFATDTATRSVAENTAAAQSIGDPVEANDDDDGDSLTYTLGGTDAASFAIVEGSGQLQTRSALDFETKALYSVIVSVSDKKDAGGNADTVVDDTIDVTISVTNVNEQPAFSTDTATRSVAENTASAQNIGAPVAATDDDDGDSLTYTISGGTDAASFEIVAASGQLQTRGALDFETKALYSVIVSVSDSKDADGTADTAADDTIDVTISVTNADEAGALSVPGTPRVDSALSASLFDPDGAVTSVTWTWESSSDGNTWTTIAGATSASYTPVAADLGRQLRVTASYTDPQGSGKSAVATLAAVQAALVVNHQPAFSTDTATRSVAENTAAGEDIGAPVEAGGDDDSSLTYTLGGTDASSFEIVAASGQLQTRSALDFETKALYSVTVSVSDKKDSSGNTDDVIDATVVVTITVADVNERPTLTGDFEVSVPEHGHLLVTRYTANDPEGGPLTWFLSGSDDDEFELTDDGDLRFRAEPDFERPADSNGDNIYRLGVWVTDGHNTPSREVLVTVTNVDEPGSIALTSVQPQVGTPLTASLSDPDGAVTSVTWTWESSSDGGNTWTTIAGATSASYTPVTADLGRQLRVTAAYTDPQGAGKSAVATLAAVEAALVVNHQPAFSTDTATRSVAENTAAAQSIGDPVEANDDDDGDSLTYTLGGTDAASFAIVEGSGQLQTRSALDFETKALYSVIVSVSDKKDAGGNADTVVDDTIDVTISVTNVNEQPAFSTDTATRSVAENTASAQNIGAPVAATDDDDGDSLTYTISGGTDAASFEIVAASGQLQTRGALDFETKALYSVIVSVSDSKDADGTADTAADDTIDVTISVTNADEAGALSVPGTPRVDSALSASLFDPDGAVTSVTWTWESSSDGNTWTTIAGATSASYTPVAADLGRQLRVTASYTDPQGSGKSAVATLAAVQAALVVNHQPAFSTDTATRSVAENTAAGEDIGAPVEAGDDDDSSLTYTLGGTDASSFEIVAASGQLQTRSALDFETKALYSVTVSVSDKKDSSGNADTAVDDTIDVTVSVTNVNEQPAFSTDTATRSVAENTAAAQNIGAPVEATDDDDGDALTYSISGGTDAASFEIVAASGQLQTKSALDFEAKALYSVIVSVSDSKDADGTADTAADDTIDVTISVTNTDEAGVLSVPGTPRVDSALSASLSDPDGAVTSVTWTWESSSDDGNTWTTIAGATTASYTPVAADLALQLRVTAAYTDPQGAGKSAVATLAAVQAALVVNHQPAFADTMTTRSVAENTAAGEDIGAPVEATDDDNGDSLTYTLGGDDAASFAIVAGSGQLQTRGALDFETKAMYSVTVSVSDKKDAGGNADTAVDDTIDVTISVTNVNERPTLTGDFEVSAPEHGDLLVTRYTANDPEGGPLTWLLSGSDDDDFELTDDGDLRFRAEPDFERPADSNGDNIYRLGVWVTDGHNTPSREVLVTVTNVDEPGSIALTSVQPQVGTPLTASLSDPDGAVTSVTWTWESSSDGGNTWTTIAGATSASYTPVTADLGRQLRVTAAYTDPQGAGKSAVATLAAVEAALVVNHQPAFSTDTATRSVAENTGAGEDIGAPVEAGDDDDSSLTYTLGGTDASSFAIVEGSGQLQTRSALDFETKALYSVTVSVSDRKDADGNADTAADDTIDVTISVTNVNEQPAFSTDTATRSVAENTAASQNIGAPVEATDDDDGDALTYSISGGTDAASFEIVAASGQLQTKSALDFETKALYSVIVSVSDSKDAGGTADTAADDTIAVTISVTNADEAGALSVPGTPRVDSALSASLSDPDGAVTSVTWTWESSSDGGNTWTTIAGATTASYTPVTADLGRQLRVTAAYTDPQGSGKSAVATLAAVQAAHVVNHQPAFADTMTTRSVAENTAAGEDIGAPVEAGDDDGDSLTYTLGGDDAASFAIVAGSGQLQTRGALDFETKALYSVIVSVSDKKDAGGNADTVVDDTIDVTISVTNVNERPTLTGDFEVSAPEHGDLLVTRYTANDPERGPLTWLLSGADDDDFELTDDGDLRFLAEPDFERPADSNGDNIYRLGVWVSDGHNTPSREVFVTVTNVDERGSIALTSVQPQVGTPLTATLTDPDGGVRAVSWQWQSSTDRTSWVDITSATGASYTPMPADEGTFLRVTSAYDDNQRSGKTAETVLGVVRAAPASNTPPAFPTGETGQRTVSEDAAPGQPIGDPVGAVDDDPGDTTALTYSLDRAAEEVFDIVPKTGQLLTAAPLNYEHVTSYTVTVTATDPSTAVASIPVTIAVEDVNEPPMLSGEPVISLPENSQGPVATYTATDPEERDLIWRLDGRDRGAFEFSDGVLSFLDPPDFESPTNAAGVNTYLVTIVVSDGMHTITRDVAVTVTDVNEAARGITGQPGTTTGGGGGPTGPSPSTVDFEWTVKRDIEALDPAHDKPTGSWSDGLTLWIAENGDGADDAIYAYNLLTGERLADREFELHESNRAPRGIWSDGETVWVADSGQNRLFAYDLTTGQRLENREIELDPRNRYARAIWSDGQTMWVLDGRANSLFAYELATGALSAEYALHSNNQDPRGLWSDGVTLWVSDHGAKRLFAYRVPSLPAAAAAAAQDVPVLERVSDEEFTALSRASNNSPRGIWADADVMYVADESDKRVYSYNMPDAIDARLQSLSLSGVDIGEFDPSRTDYDGAVGEGVTETTVTAEALQRRTDVEIDPPDADVAADGHQVALQGLTEITATVTSADGNRTKTYRVALGEAGPSASCLRGAVTVGFSLVVSEGGSVEDLAACAQSRSVTALYLLVEGEWVSYILGARDFVNEDFGELYAGGVPALTPLVARSEGPVSRAPDGTVTDPLPACLVGEIAAGFNLVVYEGGSVGDLVTCADHRDIAALYVLDDGVWVSYILGAPEFVNRSFRELFAGAVPAATPLVARSD